MRSKHILPRLMRREFIINHIYMEEVKIVPTVGRMVYFKTRGSADGVYPPTDFAAIITAVHSDTCVSLATFGLTGMRFELNAEQGQEPGEWDWMPYQKGQAKKTEELEAKLNPQGTAVSAE